MYSCEEFLGRSEFRSYSEFIFLLCVAKEFYRRGELMDFSMMNTDDVLGKKQKLMFRWCIYKGYVYAGNFTVDEPSEPEPYKFNLDAITACGDMFFRETENRYEWTNDWAKTRDFGKYWSDMYSYSQLGVILLHLVAYYIVSMRLGEKPTKPIWVYADNGIVSSSYIYVNLVNCKRTIPWFDELVDVEIDTNGKVVDVDLSLFINSGMQSDRRRHWSVKDKAKQMESEGIRVGGIYILYERKGVAKSNIVGKITNANIVRIDAIEGTSLYVTVIPVYRTKEEVEADFNEIPEDSQKSFEDMLSFKINCYSRVLGLYNLGISNYLYEEDNFIAPIDEFGTVFKLVTVDGKRATIELSQADAIYWLFKQYGISFDEKLYKLMYSRGKKFVYDCYDCSYKDMSTRVVRGTVLG